MGWYASDGLGHLLLGVPVWMLSHSLLHRHLQGDDTLLHRLQSGGCPQKVPAVTDMTMLGADDQHWAGSPCSVAFREGAQISFCQYRGVAAGPRSRMHLMNVRCLASYAGRLRRQSLTTRTRG